MKVPISLLDEKLSGSPDVRASVSNLTYIVLPRLMRKHVLITAASTVTFTTEDLMQACPSAVRLVSPLLPLALVLAGCERVQHPLLERAAIDTDASARNQSAASLSIAPVLTFPPELEEVGSSRLVRTDDGVGLELTTSDLEPGTATTLWLAVFNEPAECLSNPCGMPDLFRAETVADVLYIAGEVIGNSGKASFGSHRNVGDASGSLLAPLGMSAPGITDARAAEIHLLVHNHGTVLPEFMPDMIQTFNGGCQHPGGPFPDPLPPEYGAIGPNTCKTLQFSNHQP